MHGQRLASVPGVAHHRGLADVHHLLDHVQLAEAVIPLRFIRQRVELLLMLPAHVLNVTQPVVDQTQLVAA